MELIGQKFNKLTVLQKTEKRKNSCIVWKCKCDCGRQVEVNTTDLRTGRKKSCGCLEKINQQNFGNRTRIKNSKDRTNVKYGRLIALSPTKKRKGTNIIWHCRCDCGKQIDVAGNLLGKAVFSCGCLRKEIAKEKSEKRIIDLTNKQFGNLKVLSYIKIDNKPGSHWLCQCKCGNQIVASANNLKSGKTHSCGCQSFKSKGEEKIAKILTENHIKFEREKIFQDCCYNKLPARFDFFVDNKYIIEYDGEQHFKDGFFGTAQENQKKDAFKNQYCAKNHIPIIRISYIYFDKIELKDLLLTSSKFIVTK